MIIQREIDIQNIYFILYTLNELSKNDGGHTITKCGEHEDPRVIIEIIGNRNYFAKLISILAPHLSTLTTHNTDSREYNTRTTRLSAFVQCCIHKGIIQQGGGNTHKTSRKRGKTSRKKGGTRKLMRRDNTKIAPKTSSRRVSYRSSYKSNCRNKTKNMKRSNNKITRRKRRY